MNIKYKLGIISLFIILLQACTSAHLMPVKNPAQAMKPQPGKSLVVFMRTSFFGGGIQSTVYNGTDYIATVSAGTRIAYQAEPGEHMFMVIGESADFMKANLTAGKTYYAVVRVRPGLWKARFSFAPVKNDVTRDGLNSMIESTDLMEPNQEGLIWAKGHEQNIKAKYNKYLSDWQAKDEAARTAQTLKPEDGR